MTRRRSNRRAGRGLDGVALAVTLALAAFGGACGRPVPAPLTDAASPAPTREAGALDGGVVTTLALAEDQRRGQGVPPPTLASHDVRERRAAARALARIADEPAAQALLGLLADDDPEVVTWAAYGLGYTCKGHEDAHVKALVARAASLPSDAAAPPAPLRGPRGVFAPETAVARALGRCATPLAEDVLGTWLTGKNVYSAPAALGLGDLAVRRKSLRPTTVAALVSVAALPGMGAVFHPLARVAHGPKEAPLVLAAARAALAHPAEERVLVVKTLAKVGRGGATELGAIASATSAYTPAERAEAARGLGLLGDAGHAAAAEALLNLVPDQDAGFVASLRGPLFGILLALIESLGEESPARAEPVLSALMRLDRPPGSKDDPTLSRRIDELRCVSALGLALGGYDVSGLVGCAEAGSEPQERARLKAVLRRPIYGGRRTAFVDLARSSHIRIREAATEEIGRHPELGELGRELLAEALASDKAGLVATAADVVVAHPERLLVVTTKERRAALDPRAPPPSSAPAKELDPKLAKALEVAITRAWPEDRFETRLSLLEAAVATGHPAAQKAALAACASPNVTMRERAQKALKSLGEARACERAPPAPTDLAPELATLATSVTFAFDSGEIVLRLEPELSPATVARLVALARAGFYKGIVVHRVVPGFVLQFGDPDADGYGGSGVPLRCETSPAPFGPRDVGMALAGRDTGSSQLFVTLARTPHLDGEYTRVGRAEGDVDRVAQGDVVRDVRVATP